MFLKRSGKALALSILLLAAGCSSTEGVHKDVGSLFQSASTNSIKIDSDPSGAAVYIMGEKLGVTPLVISRKDSLCHRCASSSTAPSSTVPLKITRQDERVLGDEKLMELTIPAYMQATPIRQYPISAILQAVYSNQVPFRRCKMISGCSRGLVRTSAIASFGCFTWL